MMFKFIFETALLLSMLIQHFNFSLCDDQEQEMEMAVAMRPEGGLRIRVSPI